MNNLIELLKKPKEFVSKCQYWLDKLGFDQEYDYDRYINEELGELINNHQEGNHDNNRALLVDDIVDSMWVVLAKSMYVSLDLIVCDNFPYYSDDNYIYHIKYYVNSVDSYSSSNLSSIFRQLIFLAQLNNIDWQAAFAALAEENMSKLNFDEELAAEVFRTGKLNKKDPEGNLYPWYRPADFSKF